MSQIVNLNIKTVSDDFLIFETPEGATGKDLLTFLEKCGSSCCCEFKKIRRRRSTGERSQNHHLNGHIMQICRECGMTSPSEYEQVKTEVKRIAHITFGYPSTTLGNGLQVYKSEGDADTLECSWLIESVHLLASDLGIILIETE